MIYVEYNWKVVYESIVNAPWPDPIFVNMKPLSKRRIFEFKAPVHNDHEVNKFTLRITCKNSHISY